MDICLMFIEILCCIYGLIIDFYIKKNMKKNLLVLFVIILFKIVSAQAIIKKCNNFTVLRVFDKIPVTLISSTEEKVEVDGIKKERVRIFNKGGELIIEMDQVQPLNDGDVNVKVYYKKLKNIHAYEGASIIGSDKLESNLLNIGATEGAKVTLLVGVNKIHAKLDKGGEIKVSGSASNQRIHINSDGTYDAKRVGSNKVNVKVFSGGTATINANGSVAAKIIDGGNINVYGGAVIIKKAIEGGYLSVY